MGIYDVFISYRRGESENGGTAIAESLYRYLTEKGLRVFFDVEKMKDGHYFWPQIEEGIKVAPNYVLIGTTEAFRFRDVDEENEQRDYVKEEITLALSEYEKSAEERTVTVLVAPDANIPEIKDMPPAQRRITLAQRIIPEYGKAVSAVFPKVFNAVTQISRRNLWNAAQRWYENSCSADGRFSSLSIDETIMPFTSENRPHSDLPIRVSSEERNNAPKPLLEALNSTEGHLYLIGQGGIGKTTALMHIMKQAYDKKAYAENAQIPIFVELSYAPDSASGQIYANGKSTFIRRAIFRQVRAERAYRIFGDSEIETLTDLFGLPYDLAVRPIVDLLRQESPAPEYLLLLDGLNEVSTQTIEATLDDGGKTKATVYEMIRGEILWLIENCPNVRIVLTSRADESAISENITKLYLSGIDETAALEYLRNTGTDGKKIRDAEIERIKNNAELMRVLRVPLFLTMYATLRDKNEATAAGEILRVFFNERRRGLSDHTIKDHLTRIEKNVNSDSAGFLEGRITANMYDFILDFILPEIAWHLERKGEFLFSAREIRDIIMPILKERDDLAICGDFGQEAFTAFCSSNPEDNTASTAEKLLSLANDESKVNRMILGICVNVLGILRFSDNKYGFVHQHIRDYFAAVKNVNTMRLSVYMFEEGEKDLALECMNRVFRDEPISISVCRFMGEYLGEHKNKPYFADGKWNYGVPKEKCDRSLMERSIDLYRGRFHTENLDGFALFSIIQIIKEIRTDLSGCVFSDLDITGLRLNGVFLAREGIKAQFNNTLLSGQVFVATGHTDNVGRAYFSPDSRLIITHSKDETTRLWNAKTCLEIAVLNNENFQCFSADGKKIITTNGFDRNVTIWDVEVGIEKIVSLSQEYGMSSGMDSFVFSADGTTVISASRSGLVKIWNATSGRLEKTIENCMVINMKPYDYNNLVTLVLGEGLYCVFSDGFKTELWNNPICLNLEKIYDLAHQLNAVPRSAYISPDGKTIVYGLDKNKSILWDIESDKMFGVISGRVCPHCFSSDGQTIVTVDWYNPRLWNATSGKEIGQLIGHKSSVNCACFSPDGERILSASWDCTSRIWDSKTFKECGCLGGYYKKTKTVCFSPNGERFVLVQNDRVARLWDSDSFQELGVFEGHLGDVNSVCFSPNGKMLVTAANDSTPILWEIEDYKRIGGFKGHSKNVNYVSFSNNGKMIVTASDDCTVRVWDIEKRSQIGDPLMHEASVCSACFSPDDNKIVSSSVDGKVKIWNTNTAQLISILPRETDTITYALHACFSANGKEVITKEKFGGVRFWNLAENTFKSELQGNTISEQKDWYIYYTSDNEFVVHEENEQIGVSWKTSIDKKSGVLHESRSPLRAICFSANKKLILSLHKNGDLIMWDAVSFTQIHKLQTVLGIMISGCDFHNLHPDSHLTDEEEEILRRYGALFD